MTIIQGLINQGTTVYYEPSLYEPSLYPPRISGNDRYQTAVEVSKTGWPEGADTVILARGDDFADALAGVPLAYLLDAPILLTRTDRTVSATMAEIERLGANRIILLGGTVAISDEVEQELKTLGFTVDRIAGANRFATAALIAQHMVDEGAEFNTAFIAVGTNFADALAASSYAAVRGQPILLTATTHLPSATQNIISDLGIVNTWVCGGVVAVSEEVFDLLPNARRLYGNDRYLTALAMAEEFLPESTKHVYISTGLNFPDAVAGGVLAAKNNSGVLLVRGTHTEPSLAVQEFISDHGITIATIFGGTFTISSELEEWFRDNL